MGPDYIGIARSAVGTSTSVPRVESELVGRISRIQDKVFELQRVLNPITIQNGNVPEEIAKASAMSEVSIRLQNLEECVTNILESVRV